MIDAVIAPLRRLARRFAKDGIDDECAYLSEGVLAAMAKISAFDPNLGAITSYVLPYAFDAMRAHTKSITCAGVTRQRGLASGVTTIGVDADLEDGALFWAVEAEQERYGETERDERRRRLTRIRMAKMRLRMSAAARAAVTDALMGKTLVETAEELGVTKQAVSLRRVEGLKALKRCRWRSVGSEAKTDRVGIRVTSEERAAARSLGLSLSAVVAECAWRPPSEVSAAGGDVVWSGRAERHVVQQVVFLAETRGVSVSALVRSKVQEMLESTQQETAPDSHWVTASPESSPPDPIGNSCDGE